MLSTQIGEQSNVRFKKSFTNVTPEVQPDVFVCNDREWWHSALALISVSSQSETSEPTVVYIWAGLLTLWHVERFSTSGSIKGRQPKLASTSPLHAAAREEWSSDSAGVSQQTFWLVTTGKAHLLLMTWEVTAFLLLELFPEWRRCGFNLPGTLDGALSTKRVPPVPIQIEISHLLR